MEIDAMTFVHAEHREWLSTFVSPSLYSKGRTPAQYLWQLCRCLVRRMEISKEYKSDVDYLKDIRTVFQSNGIPEPEHWSTIGWKKLASGDGDGETHFNIAIGNLREYLEPTYELRKELKKDLEDAETGFSQIITEIQSVKAENRVYEGMIEKIKTFIETQENGPEKSTVLEILANCV